ncbi:MAG: TRAP transporter substrate-binding protein [Oscillospiraceae bacterium]
MKKARKIPAVLLAGVLAAAVLAGCASGDPSGSGQSGDSVSASTAVSQKTIKFDIGENEEHYLYDGAVAFKEYVEANTDGAIVVDIYPASALGDDFDVLESIQLGQVEMNAPSPAVLANFVKEFDLLTFPFLFDTQEIADAVTTGEFGQKLLSKCSDAGFHGICIGDFGYRHVTNSIKPIETVDDLSGLKIRTMENSVHLDTFRALGANPTAMGWSEVFTSLQQGTIDGQENPFTGIWTAGIYEVQPYISKTAHVYDWVVFVIGQDFYDDLTAEQQKVVDEAGEIARETMASLSAQRDAEAEQKIIESGKTAVNEISSEVRDEMKSLVEPVKEKYAATAGPELYELLKSEIAKAG